MVQTNVQAFSGDVEISSNVSMSSNVFIKGPGPTSNVVAIGIEAGYTTQGIDSIAIGTEAGKTAQNTLSVAVGCYAGQTAQYANATAVGFSAGNIDQHGNATAMGFKAGCSSQGAQGTAVGFQAGMENQGSSCVAIGNTAGCGAQGTGAVSIGVAAGSASQGTNSVAIGNNTAGSNQGDDSISIGRTSGSLSQNNQAISIGYAAGILAQGFRGVAIGLNAGYSNQGDSSIAIGRQAGNILQGFNSIAIGRTCGYEDQGSDSVAIGYDAGRSNQGSDSTAIGLQAGYEDQGDSALAVGVSCGRISQGPDAVALGFNCGSRSQANQAVAIGSRAGEYAQGSGSIAIGRMAGRSNQGSYAIAVGYTTASTFNQPANTTWWRYASLKNASGHQYLRVYNTGEVVRVSSVSDDRLKYDEKFITGAIKSLFKLRPQEYLKKPKLIPDPDRDEEWERESGLMAQEVYYSAPELRHLVRVSETAGDIDNYTPPPSDDPAVDPDYSVWGNEASGVEYIQLIPYLIKGIQEIVTELPRSKTTVSNTWGQNVIGLVVSADTNTHKTNTVPIVTLSNVYMDKKWYGVVSDQKTDTNDYDTLVDTKGDTRIWVTDVGGPLESGNLLTTSNVAPGHTQKQVDDLIRSSTVAKVTQDCDFTEPIQHAIRVPKRELSNVKYYVKSITSEIELSVYELYNNIHTSVETTPMYIYEVQEEKNSNHTRFYSGGVEVSSLSGKEDPTTKYFMEKTPDEYENLDDEEKAKYTLGTRNVYKLHSGTRSSRPIPEHEEEVFVEELVDVLDENGQIVWEDTANTAPAYTLVDHGTHKAALLTCKIV